MLVLGASFPLLVLHGNNDSPDERRRQQEADDLQRKDESIHKRIANLAHDESAAPTGTSLERESGLEARFGVRWQTMPGPTWVQRVPTWLVEDAKTYHRRGLPVLHLWESSNYLVALGLSNHGVPGVYFSQKLP